MLIYYLVLKFKTYMPFYMRYAKIDISSAIHKYDENT